jgi:hypothetical protein
VGRGGGATRADPAATGTTVRSAPGRSKAPTPEEWDDLRMATIKGALALRCEVKLLREWLRVRCKGKNDNGGTPAGIHITKGEGPDTVAYHQGAVMSLVTPFVDGTDLQATFAWSDQSYPLTIQWPSGARKPRVLGVFDGAPSPPFPFKDDDFSIDSYVFTSYDELERWMKMYDRLCNCYKQNLNVTTCHSFAAPNFFGHWNPNGDCDRSYGNDCTKLMSCSTVWPSVHPLCLPGHILGPWNRCFKECRATSDCPRGRVCEEQTEFPAGTGGVCWYAK